MSNNYNNTRTQPSYSTPAKDEMGKTSSLTTPIHSHLGVPTPLKTTPPNTTVSATPTSSALRGTTTGTLRDPQETVFYGHDHVSRIYIYCCSTDDNSVAVNHHGSNNTITNIMWKTSFKTQI